MDLEQERERQRRSYRLCWVGFAAMSLSLIVASFYAIGSLLLLFTGPNPRLGNLLGIKNFDFLIDTGRTWPRVLSAFFLWSAWGDPNWKRRSGLLVMMSLADGLLWSIEHGVLLGVLEQSVGHDVFRHSLSMVLRWSEFVLIAGLASDVSRHVGAVNADEFGRAARSTAVFGAVTWFLFFINQVDWWQSWPLTERRWTRDIILLYFGYWVILSICLVQSTLLCLLASRSATLALRQMDVEDRAVDPWASG